MTSKKDLIERINSKLPSDGGDLDLSKLPKEQLELLEKKIDAIMNMVLDGGAELLNDYVAKRCGQRIGGAIHLDNEGQSIVEKFVKNRMEHGPVISAIKDGLKRRMANKEEDKKGQ